MNPAHLHLLLNHLPVIGFGIGLALYVVAIVSKKLDLQRAGLVILFLAAAFTIITYVSGNDAREMLKKTPGISNPLMEAHETAALVAFVFMEITGFFSWIGLWTWGRPSRFVRWNVGIVLILSTLAFGLMSRAAYMGGAIRHPETEAAQTISTDASVPTLARSWGLFVQDHSWVWPACETLHFVGLCLLFGAVLVVNLRMMGIGKSLLSFAAVRQLLPLGMLGFTLNLITGMMFFVATPEQYTGFLFLLKMALIAAGALNLLYFMLAESPEKVGYGDDARPATKLVAASAIVIWIAVLFCGHMLPWLGNSF
jgi:uncharacterized membrane protein